MDDRRTYRRVPAKGTALLVYEEGAAPQEIIATMVNLSSSGMAVLASEPLERGATVSVTLVDVPPFTDRIMLGEMEVVSVTPARCGNSSGFRFGLQFRNGDGTTIARVLQGLQSQTYLEAKKRAAMAKRQIKPGRSWL